MLPGERWLITSVETLLVVALGRRPLLMSEHMVLLSNRVALCCSNESESIESSQRKQRSWGQKRTDRKARVVVICSHQLHIQKWYQTSALNRKSLMFRHCVTKSNNLAAAAAKGLGSTPLPQPIISPSILIVHSDTLQSDTLTQSNGFH